MQRIALRHDGDGLALCTWLAELKPQAEALYQTCRAQRFMDFLARHPKEWRAWPNAHLAFRNAPAAQRLYLNCRLEISEYTSTPGPNAISVRSARIITTGSGTPSGPGFGSASTQDPRMTSISMRS